MAISKSSEFSIEDQQLAEAAKALAHPARIAILKRLAGETACVCGDIVVDMPLAQSTVSQHLKELKSAGLIQGTVDGPRSCYCLDVNACSRLLESLQSLLLNLKKSCCKPDCC
jgi:DNA-binding transcriptional ArsR family regulator